MSSPIAFPLGTQQSFQIASGGLGRCVRLTAALPGTTPERALARLEAAVARHEVLRSTWHQEAAMRAGLQLVHEDGVAAWTVLDAGADVDAAVTAAVARLDPRRGPVLGGVLAPVGEDTSLTLCASVLFSDLRSLGVLAAEAAGGTPVDDPIQYAEYGAWQAEVLETSDGTDADSAAAAWARLVDDEVRTTLPWSVGSEVTPTAGLVVESPDPGGHPVSRWLALWALTVSRLTGQSAVTLGVEVDPTGNPELDGALGPYARVVPLTVDVPARGSVETLAVAIDDALALARTWFEWAPGASGPSVLFSVGPLTSHVDREPFQVELRVAPDGRHAVVVGAGAEGPPAAVAAALRRVLDAGPDAVELLDVLDRATVDRLLGAAGGSAEPVTSIPLTARLAGQASATPDRVALTDGTTSTTYAELADTVDALAAALLDAAGGATAPVAVLLPRSPDAVVAVLAAQRSGLGCVALDVEGPPERALLQAGIAGATVLVASGPAPDGFTGRVVAPDARGTAALPEPTTADLAYVMFTSGSTGVPKGVAVGADSLAGYADAVVPVVEAAAGGHGEGMIWALVTGLTTDLGLTSVVGALTSGGTLHVVPTALLHDPSRLSAHLGRHPVDVLKITPSHLRALLGDPEADVLPRRVVVLGGEVLTWDLVRAVRDRGTCAVVNHYGPTETTVGALTHPVVQRDGVGELAVPIGGPLAGYEALIVDPRLRLVPDGATGELLVAGTGVARGYVGDQDAADAVFVEHPYRPGVRAYRTGDLARRGRDGAIRFLGRRDRQTKVRGFRVEPQEIEVALTRHPAVRRAAVVLRHDLGAEPALVGYVVTQVNPAPTEAELRAFLAGRLPEHLVPSRLVDVDMFPLRANGKLDADALPPPPPATASFEPPAGETERVLVEIFAAVLGAQTLGVHDDFFALGGHSLLATRVVVEIRRRLDVQLPVHALFDAPSVRQLAELVESARGGPSADELAALIAEISAMSDEEAARRLAEEETRSAPRTEGRP